MGRKRNNLSKSINISESRQESFQGIWIPKEICLIEELNWTEKVLLAEIISMYNATGQCYFGNKTLSDNIGLSKEWTRKVIYKLVKLGYLYYN